MLHTCRPTNRNNSPHNKFVWRVQVPVSVLATHQKVCLLSSARPRNTFLLVAFSHSPPNTYSLPLNDVAQQHLRTRVSGITSLDKSLHVTRTRRPCSNIPYYINLSSTKSISEFIFIVYTYYVRTDATPTCSFTRYTSLHVRVKCYI